MANSTSLRGPVELVDGKLLLRIPLAAGGQALVACSRGIGTVEGEYLCVHIQQWLADKLGLKEGSLVDVDNENGTFNMSPVPAEPDD